MEHAAPATWSVCLKQLGCQKNALFAWNGTGKANGLALLEVNTSTMKYQPRRTALEADPRLVFANNKHIMANTLGSVFPPSHETFRSLRISWLVFPLCDIGGWAHTEKTPALFNNFLLEKSQRHNVLLPFVVVVYAVLLGKFPAHPGGEGIMTGLWSGEEEIRAEFQRSLLDCFSYTVSISSALIRELIWKSELLEKEPYLGNPTKQSSSEISF